MVNVTTHFSAVRKFSVIGRWASSTDDGASNQIGPSASSFTILCRTVVGAHGDSVFGFDRLDGLEPALPDLA